MVNCSDLASLSLKPQLTKRQIASEVKSTVVLDFPFICGVQSFSGWLRES